MESRLGSLGVPLSQDLSPRQVQQVLGNHVSVIIGDATQLHDAAATYFRTVHAWLPFMSEALYLDRISAIGPEPAPADFSLLSLTMYLACAMPCEGQLPNWVKTLYRMAKTWLATLEVVEGSSIDMVQSRLLLTIFELGHGLLPAAYMSAGSNVRAVTTLGSDASNFPGGGGGKEEVLDRTEETLLTWDAVLIVDRYATLAAGRKSKATFGSICRGTKASQHNWEQHGSRLGVSPVMDAFHDLVQASEVLERALSHVGDPASADGTKQADAVEALDTLTFFLEKFQNRSSAYQFISCSAIAVGRSAMMEILEFGSGMTAPGNEFCLKASLNVMQMLVDEVVHAASGCLSRPPGSGAEVFPVFVLHSIYKAAKLAIKLRDAGKLESIKLTLEPLRQLLGVIGARWTVAGQYLAEIKG